MSPLGAVGATGPFSSQPSIVQGLPSSMKSPRSGTVVAAPPMQRVCLQSPAVSVPTFIPSFRMAFMHLPITHVYVTQALLVPHEISVAHSAGPVDALDVGPLLVVPVALVVDPVVVVVGAPPAEVAMVVLVAFDPPTPPLPSAERP